MTSPAGFAFPFAIRKKPFEIGRLRDECGMDAIDAPNDGFGL